jgi:hypothetical protein
MMVSYVTYRAVINGRDVVGDLVWSQEVKTKADIELLKKDIHSLSLGGRTDAEVLTVQWQSVWSP